uniref:Protein kinase domain-containing protein n=1 Tax=Meloidogyne incognita TaxID=6306 RepID=A0A914LWD0_MELIC
MKAETPKKIPTLEADGAKAEKKLGGGKGDNSPKDDQLLLQAKGGDGKKAQPVDKGKEEAKEAKASSRNDIISIPIGVNIGQYRVEEALGGCGVVYKIKTKGGEYHAMKLERTDQKRRDQLLPLEAHVLKQLQFTDYAAKFIEYGKCSCEFLNLFYPKFSKKFFYFFTKGPVIYALVMALLGKSISDLQDKRDKFKFTTGTVLRIGLRIYYVHRDVKPSNFAIDRQNQKRVYLIDFGLSRSLRKRATKLLRKPRMDVPFRGTPGYCSLNAHKRVELGRHDDLWSLVYMMVDLNNGSLPWFGQENREHAAVLKGCPLAFRSIMDYLRTLTYKQLSDYNGLESIFIQMLEARDISGNQSMDWEPLYIKRLEEVKKPSEVSRLHNPF